MRTYSILYSILITSLVAVTIAAPIPHHFQKTHDLSLVQRKIPIEGLKKLAYAIVAGLVGGAVWSGITDGVNEATGLSKRNEESLADSQQRIVKAAQMLVTVSAKLELAMHLPIGSPEREAALLRAEELVAKAQGRFQDEYDTLPLEDKVQLIDVIQKGEAQENKSPMPISRGKVNHRPVEPITKASVKRSGFSSDVRATLASLEPDERDVVAENMADALMRSLEDGKEFIDAPDHPYIENLSPEQIDYLRRLPVEDQRIILSRMLRRIIDDEAFLSLNYATLIRRGIASVVDPFEKIALKSPAFWEAINLEFWKNAGLGAGLSLLLSGIIGLVARHGDPSADPAHYPNLLQATPTVLAESQPSVADKYLLDPDLHLSASPVTSSQAAGVRHQKRSTFQSQMVTAVVSAAGFAVGGAAIAAVTHYIPWLHKWFPDINGSNSKDSPETKEGIKDVKSREGSATLPKRAFIDMKSGWDIAAVLGGLVASFAGTYLWDLAIHPTRTRLSSTPPKPSFLSEGLHELD